MKCRYCGVEIELEGIWSSVASRSTLCKVSVFTYHQPYPHVDSTTLDFVKEDLRQLLEATQ